MKKLIFAIFALAITLPGVNSSAQGKYGADSADCIKYLSYYKEYYKQRNYDEALPNWRKAYKLCPPTASQNMILDGTSMLRRLIVQNQANETYKKALIDSLMALHDTRIQYYPKYARTALNNKGLDISNYKKDDAKALYNDLNDIIAQNKEYTSPNIFIIDFNAAVELYQKGEISAEDVIGSYQNSQSYLEEMQAKNDADEAQKLKVKTDLENLFLESKVASCDKIIELYTPRYESNPDDLELVTNIVKMMGAVDGCTDNELYINAATSYYKLQPSYASAYFLYRLNASKGNTADAIKYLEEAISYDDSDAKTDAEYCYELAAFCVKNGMNSKAYEYARKSSELDASFAGKSYFLMGTIWGSTACGGNEIEKRAPYWVAVDYLIKARNADPSLTDDANRLIGQYSSYYPQASEAFMYDITNGQSYTVSCGGMRATTTVRTQK
ncbi:MAG: hypothetical protein WCS67_07530 [Bacteroidales bacterium]